MTPFLQYSTRRDLREQLHRAYFMRGDRDNANDNKEIVKKIVLLRAERAKLLGYPTHAHFVLEERMAKDPDTVMAFLQTAVDAGAGSARKTKQLKCRPSSTAKKAASSWPPGTGGTTPKNCARKNTPLTTRLLRPYFALENVKKGIFTLCEKLYGLQFIKLDNLPLYHSEVQVYEVRESDGSHVGLLYMDFHPRPGKRGGAWSGGFRRAYYEKGKRVAPISTLVCNFTRPAADAPSLLSIDEVNTFFHEFGHSLNTLFSNGVYRSRSVPRDAVELPSQIMENWALEPEMLEPLRPPLPDRRSDPGGAGGKAEKQQPVQPGLRDRGIPGRLAFWTWPGIP